MKEKVQLSLKTQRRQVNSHNALECVGLLTVQVFHLTDTRQGDLLKQSCADGEEEALFVIKHQNGITMDQPLT